MKQPQWYVLYVRANQEKTIERYINNLGDELYAFCPMVKELRLYSDRKKKVEKPLFKSMLFIKAREEDRAKVFAIPGTLRYLYYLGRPGVVKKEEMDYLIQVNLNKGLLTPELQQIEPGATIDLTKMGFFEKDGVVQKVTKNNIWVLLTDLGYIVKLGLK
jgi:transcriptional antiterminator RfaH